MRARAHRRAGCHYIVDEEDAPLQQVASWSPGRYERADEIRAPSRAGEASLRGPFATAGRSDPRETEAPAHAHPQLLRERSAPTDPAAHVSGHGAPALEVAIPPVGLCGSGGPIAEEFSTRPAPCPLGAEDEFQQGSVVPAGNAQPLRRNPVHTIGARNHKRVVDLVPTTGTAGSRTDLRVASAAECMSRRGGAPAKQAVWGDQQLPEAPCSGPESGSGPDLELSESPQSTPILVKTLWNSGTSRAIFRPFRGGVAQLAEQGNHNPWVRGSSPCAATLTLYSGTRSGRVGERCRPEGQAQ